MTNKYYKQIPEARVFEIFEQFDNVATNEDEDKELMLRFHEHELVKGTPEFERARRLVSERRSKLAIG